MSPDTSIHLETSIIFAQMRFGHCPTVFLEKYVLPPFASFVLWPCSDNFQSEGIIAKMLCLLHCYVTPVLCCMEVRGVTLVYNWSSFVVNQNHSEHMHGSVPAESNENKCCNISRLRVL